MHASADHGPCRTYAEADLAVCGRPVRGGLPALVRDLVEATTPQQREHLVRRALQAGGFEWLSYVTEALEGGRWCAAQALATYTHPAWERCDAQGRHCEVDPRVLAASRSSMPLVWHLTGVEAQACAPGASSRLHRLADDLRRAGIGSGVLFVMPCESTPGPRRTVIHLMSSRNAADWLGDTGLARALTLGFGLHEFYTRHASLPAPLAATRPDRADSADWSAVQREIAGQLLQGRSDKEIAALLHLSCHTVDYHMRQLRQRFSARNRVQIVSALRHVTHAEPTVAA